MKKDWLIENDMIWYKKDKKKKQTKKPEKNGKVSCWEYDDEMWEEKRECQKILN